MRRLVIETATEACSVALFDGDALVAHLHEVVGRGHAERLIPMIAELPDRGRGGAILVDCGPGSFTGVRVGIAAARALGLAWGVPVTGCSSMAMLAAAAFAEPGAPETLAAVVTAGHGELFVQRFSGQPMRPISPLRALPPDEAAAACPDAWLVGSGAAALVAAGGRGEARAAVPDARDAARLPTELSRLPPSAIYGRAPDARLPA